MIVDLWDIDTLPEDARKLLIGGDELFREYMGEEQRITAELPEVGPRIRRRNEMRGARDDLEGTLADLVAEHEIRCFHYTRMIDEEVQFLRETGVVVTSHDFLRERLDRVVCLGHLEKDVADVIHGGSALRNDYEYGKRNGMFWVCAVPIQTDDSRVTMLLDSWGGESAYWTVNDQVVSDRLKAIGRPRILELAVPVRAALPSGPRVLAGRLVDLRMNQLGLIRKEIATDFYLEQNLPSAAILTIHTNGDGSFDKMGRGYPQSYEPVPEDDEDVG